MGYSEFGSEGAPCSMVSEELESFPNHQNFFPTQIDISSEHTCLAKANFMVSYSLRGS